MTRTGYNYTNYYEHYRHRQNPKLWIGIHETVLQAATRYNKAKQPPPDAEVKHALSHWSFCKADHCIYHR